MFTEYALQARVAHKNAAGFDSRLGSHETQKIASRVFAALEQYLLGKRGRPRFKGLKLAFLAAALVIGVIEARFL